MKNKKIIRLLSFVFIFAIMAAFALNVSAMGNKNPDNASTNIPDRAINRRDATNTADKNDTLLPENNNSTGALDEALKDASDAIDDAKDTVDNAVDDTAGTSIMGVVIAILIAVAIIILIIIMVSKSNEKHNTK